MDKINHYYYIKVEELVEDPGRREKLGELLERGREKPSAHRAGGREYRLLAMLNIGSQITC